MAVPAILALEDGSLFHGISKGISGQAVGEVIFNTSMTGYQEILTDPSYCRQIVTLTHPHIGNVGVNTEDCESDTIHAAALVMRDLPHSHSNWRSDKNLPAYLQANNIVAIADIDTRRLTRILREKGAQKGCVTAGIRPDTDSAIRAARQFPGLAGMDLVKQVTAPPYTWQEGPWSFTHGYRQTENPEWRVTVYNFGVKKNILRNLNGHGCRLTVVPATTPVDQVLAEKPNGVLLSNGPGDPEPCDYAIDSIRQLLGSKIPLFGICLGHQLLALALGAKTVKMKTGHHGANHPVQELDSGKVLITSQNHGFAVDQSSIPAQMTITHKSLFDGSIQGIRHNTLPAFGFQGHPEASPGPHDIFGLFQKFIELMQAQS